MNSHWEFGMSREQMRDYLTNNSDIYKPLREVNQTLPNVIGVSDEYHFVRQLFEAPPGTSGDINPSTSSGDSGDKPPQPPMSLMPPTKIPSKRKPKTISKKAAKINITVFEDGEYVCKICEKGFATDYHVMNNVGQDYKCCICQVKFFTKEKYLEHLSKFTVEDKSFHKCCSCELVINDAEWSDHIKNCYKNKLKANKKKPANAKKSKKWFSRTVEV